jgi:flagellar biosynthesis component FlhA
MFQLALYVIGGLGTLVITLFGLGLAVLRWAIQRYETGQTEAQSRLNARLDIQDETLRSIKDFMAKELYELREWFHRLDKDVIVIKERELRGSARFRKTDDIE